MNVHHFYYRIKYINIVERGRLRDANSNGFLKNRTNHHLQFPTTHGGKHLNLVNRKLQFCYLKQEMHCE